MWDWRFENENFELKIWSLKDTWKLWKRFFFFWLIESTQFDRVDLAFGWLLSVGAEILAPPLPCLSPFSFLLHLSSTSLPPLTLFTFFFPLIFLLHVTISSHKKHFSKLLNLPSYIFINISLDSCILSIFITHPFLVKPIF